MAKTKLNGTLVRADHHRPTAPLPAPAVEALARLELAFAAPEVAAAVARFGRARDRRAEVQASNWPLLRGSWSLADRDAFDDCDRDIAEACTVLAAAGMLHLVGVGR